MSDIQRRITMLWDSRGASQVKASIGQMSSGLSSYRRELRGVSGEQSVMDKQMRAFGTTLRYALAGGALFGTVNTLRNLGEFQAKLGEISAIGASNKFPLVGRQLDELGQKLLQVSTNTATPIGEIQEAVTNLYSTINNLSPDEAVTTITTIAKVARNSQADITDTTQALLGLMDAYNESPRDIPQIGDEFFQTTRLAAGGANFAKVYAQQLGRLSQGAVLGDFTQEQIGALSIGASRFGGSTATNSRGLAQLFRVIKQPTTKDAKAAYAQAGLTIPGMQSMQGWDVLMQLLTYANAQGSGKGTFMTQAFTRSESRNVALTLSKLLTPEQVAGSIGIDNRQNQTLDEYLQQVTDSAGEVDRAMDRAMDMRRIQQAGIAMSNFSLAFANAFNPLIQPAAKGIVGASSAFQGFAADHQAEVIIGTGLAGGALLAARLGKLGKLGKRAPGLGGLAAAGAVSDTLTGGHVRGDSPMNPLYVIVVSQLVGGPKFGRGMRNQFPGGQGPQPKPSGRFGKIPLAGWGLAGGALAVASLAMMTNGGAAHGADRSAFPRINRLLNRVTKGFPISQLSPAEQQAVQSLGNYSATTAPKPRLAAAESILDNAVNAGLKISGNATVTVNIDSTDAKGNPTRKTTKVPLPLFSSFTPPAPQTKGKNKTTRGK